MVSALGSQPSDPGSIPGPRLVDRECDGNALKALLRKPPCRTCKKDQASIKVQDYWSGSLDLIIFITLVFYKNLALLLGISTSHLCQIHFLETGVHHMKKYMGHNPKCIKESMTVKVVQNQNASGFSKNQIPCVFFHLKLSRSPKKCKVQGPGVPYHIKYIWFRLKIPKMISYL